MKHKLLNLAGCAILVLAALAPMVSAHNQAPAAGDADTNVILNGGGIEAEFGAFEDDLADLSELPDPFGAHVDNDRYASPYNPGGCNTFTGGSGQTICEDRSGVSGRYVGSAFFANAVGGSSENSLFPLATVPNPANPTVGPPTFTLLPNGIFSSSTGPFCDFEIAGDGSNYDTSDETTVDGFTPPAGSPNSIPNGLWDDGGQGGACHTTGYNNAVGAGKYGGADNTPGCPAGEYARAEDAVSGDSVWIATSCDVTQPVVGDSPSLLNCWINGIGLQRDWATLTSCFNDTYTGCSFPQYLQGQPIPAPGPGFPPNSGQLPAIENCIRLALTGELACNVTFSFPPTPGELQTCVTNIALDIILCEPPITTSNCLPPPAIVCGSDNGADVTLFGEGGAHNDAGDTEPLSPTGRAIYDDGVPFAGDANCSLGVGQAFVSALTGVHVEIPRLQGLADGTFAPGDDGVAVNLALATTGWISTVSGQSETEATGIGEIGDGFDLFATNQGRTLIGIFAMGDEKFPLQHFQGVPIGSYDFGSGTETLSDTDTIVHHTAASANVPVSLLELKKLQLQGVEDPTLFVTLQSERNPADLLPDGPPSMGFLRLSFNPGGSGGTFDSAINVNFDIRKGANIDAQIIGSASLVLTTQNTPWSHELPSSFSPSSSGNACMDHPESADPAGLIRLVAHGICNANDVITGVNNMLNGVDSTADFYVGAATAEPLLCYSEVTAANGGLVNADQGCIGGFPTTCSNDAPGVTVGAVTTITATCTVPDGFLVGACVAPRLVEARVAVAAQPSPPNGVVTADTLCAGTSVLAGGTPVSVSSGLGVAQNAKDGAKTDGGEYRCVMTHAFNAAHIAFQGLAVCRERVPIVE